MSSNAPSTALLPAMSSPADGSRTITTTTDPTGQDNQDRAEENGPGAPQPVVGVLRLRGTRRTGPRVAWDDEVVDNEHMGKKKSKICCIYHKPRRFDESSSDDDSDDDSDGSCRGHGHNHDHEHSGPHRSHHHYHHRHRQRPDIDGKKESSDSESGPNAYERKPKEKGKGGRKSVITV